VLTDRRVLKKNVHFVLPIHAPEVVGYKALARATSDLAAMGARPRYFLLSLALPPSCTGKWFDRFLKRNVAGSASPSASSWLEATRREILRLR